MNKFFNIPTQWWSSTNFYGTVYSFKQTKEISKVHGDENIQIKSLFLIYLAMRQGIDSKNFEKMEQSVDCYDWHATVVRLKNIYKDDK